MMIYRCRICESPCLGQEGPTHCCFCGARRKFLVAANDFRRNPVGELAEKSRGHLQRLFEIAMEDSAFFRAAAQVADSEEGRGLFEALVRVVAQQAKVLGRTLGNGRPPAELHETGNCSPSHRENLRESAQRARRAMEECRSGLADAEEERVREILEAFIEVRQDHLGLFR